MVVHESLGSNASLSLTKDEFSIIYSCGYIYLKDNKYVYDNDNLEDIEQILNN